MIPTVSISAPTSGTTVSGTVNVTGLASDSLGISSVSLYCDGNMVSSTSSSNFSIPWNSATATAGAHTLKVTAIDKGGNSASASIGVTVPAASKPADTTPPTLQITSPANGSRIPANGSVTIDVSAQDNVGVVQVSIYVDGVWGLYTGTSAPYSAKWNAKKAASGSHTISATAWHAAGNHTSTLISVIQ